MKTLLLLLVALLLAGCAEDGKQATPPATTPTVPTTPAGAPPESPKGGPPPAWLQTESGSHWLGFSTYCWTTSCADYIAPSCDAEHVPTLELRKGEVVRLHLGFKPKEVSLVYFNGTETFADPKFDYPKFTIEREGVFAISAVAAEGEDGSDASYVGCIRFAD
jgi:hypothetical protein